MNVKKRKIGVFDLDGTLIERKGGGWFLRQFGERVLRLLIEKPNIEMVGKTKDYDEVVILTGRPTINRELTEKQLKKFNIRYDRLLMFPESEIMKWKRHVIKENFDGDVDWFDDQIRV